VSHLSWIGDSLGVQFAKSKTDQEGDHPKNSRHCFANPLIPHICPILALGLHLLSHGDLNLHNLNGHLQGALFPGGNQSSRFSRILNDLLNTEEGKEACSKYGVINSDIGTHFIRQGSCTFVCTGSVWGPSISSICKRTGWSIGTVQDVI
jgi:hypothetical protein